MGQNHHPLAMEEVEHAVVDRLQLDSKFIDIVSQVVRFRPAKLVTQLLESLQPNDDFVLGFLRYLSKPFQKRGGSVCLAIDDYLCLRQL